MPANLALPTEDDIRRVVREELAAITAKLDELGLKPRELLVIRTRREAARYLGFTREMFAEAEERGFIRPLPFLIRNTSAYPADALVEGGRAYLEWLQGRNGGEAPESKAAAGVRAPARKE